MLVCFVEKSYLCIAILRKAWAISAAGSEHLPYKQRVGGSNPSSPTKEDLQDVSPLFLCIFLNLTEIKYYLCEGNDILLYGLCGT